MNESSIFSRFRRLCYRTAYYEYTHSVDCTLNWLSLTFRKSCHSWILASSPPEYKHKRSQLTSGGLKLVLALRPFYWATDLAAFVEEMLQLHLVLGREEHPRWNMRDVGFKTICAAWNRSSSYVEPINFQCLYLLA